RTGRSISPSKAAVMNRHPGFTIGAATVSLLESKTSVSRMRWLAPTYLWSMLAPPVSGEVSHPWPAVAMASADWQRNIWWIEDFSHSDFVETPDLIGRFDMNTTLAAI